MRSRFALMTIGAMALTASAAGPAAAASAATTTPPADYGARVNCNYRVIEGGKYGWTQAKLKTFGVKPPTLYSSTSGRQTVGWRFYVERNLDQEDGSWKVTYRSPIQKRTATQSTAASFDPMQVEVALPNVEDESSVFYHVTLVMFVYNKKGSIVSRATYLMPTMHWMVTRRDNDTEDYCPGIAKQYFDGPFSVAS